MKRFTLSLSLLLCLAFAGAQTYVELILDASGSMWNKLDDGTYRITAAKDVLGNFIKGLPAGDLNVGLRIYGANIGAMDDGACDDIALVVPMEGVDKPGLQTAVDNTKAKGATPIVKALELAAADFPAEAQRKLIVLVTDGQESCGGDLNGIAEKLKSQGIEIDLKIVGFALSEKAQQSFAGVGEFVNAADAAQLASALETAVQEVVVAEPAPAPVERQAITLTVPATAPAGQYVDVSYDGPDLMKEDYLTIVAANAEETDYADYTYVDLATKKLTLTTPFEPGDYEVRYVNDSNGGVLARVPITLEKSDITMRVVGGEVRAGGSYQVEWTGPNGEADYITLVEPSAEDGTYQDYKYTRDGSTLTLTAPLTVGQYELRYSTDRAGDNGKVFARVPVEVLEAVPVFLQTSPEVPAGGEFEIEWAGPANDSDFITIVAPDASEGSYADYAYMRDGINPVLISAPVELGDYEVRYVNEREGKVLGRASVKVVASNASVQVPSEVMAGTAVDVSWSGSSSDSDFVTIVQVGAAESSYGDYVYTRDGNPVSIQAPFEPGSYEARLVNGNENKVLAMMPITLTPMQITLQASSEVPVNSNVEVSWTGPKAKRSYITIVAAGAPETDYGNNYVYVEEASGTISVRAPETPGNYEVRYLSSDNKVRHSLPITVK
jgi:Ca-activated chloride channel homolog